MTPSALYELRVSADDERRDEILADVLPAVPRRSAVRFILPARANDGPVLRVVVGSEAEAHAVAAALRDSGVRPARRLNEIELEAIARPYEGEDAVRFFAGALSRAADVAADAVRASRDRPGSRTAVFVRMMVRHLVAIDLADAFPERYPAPSPQRRGVPAAFLVYRSHADGFMLLASEPDNLRARFDESYASLAGGIRAQVRRALSDSEARSSSPSARWSRLARELLYEAAAGFDAGRLNTSEPATSLWDVRDVSASAFHREVQAQASLRAQLFNDGAYRAVRLTTSLLYVVLAVLGLALEQRAFLCHAIARACEEWCGVPAHELLRRSAERMAGRQVRDPASANRP